MKLFDMGIANKRREIDWVDAEEVQEMGAHQRLAGLSAILVPGAFGQRGADGKIEAIRYARENKVPYLGICFGMQMACVEVARNLAGMTEASSSEFGPTNQPLVGLMTEWEAEEEAASVAKNMYRSGDLGGNAFGAYEVVAPRLTSSDIYGGNRISERHRHRYEVNASYIALEKVGCSSPACLRMVSCRKLLSLKKISTLVRRCSPQPELKSRPLNRIRYSSLS